MMNLIDEDDRIRLRNGIIHLVWYAYEADFPKRHPAFDTGCGIVLWSDDVFALCFDAPTCIDCVVRDIKMHQAAALEERS